ncbi:MAG TPA: peptidylprolyl isomerase [Candidatus Cloacimonadota bacterium]|nr:peptidylprolyl isomerase [Candidatus Cloacimonadota bacterium]HOQ80351.1 peptidylprolyl isomerase [Candidatus Cloacimonadota bacterium]HPK40354.1 peptidylprolyl isomerase [Candidatus Cloacimonadota bacterium]
MNKRLLLITLLIVLILPASLHARRFARWYTNMGQFTAEIRNEIMPITGENFINLGLSHFYDNLIFHRVVEGFVIQDGCPNGTGTGGPGYTIPDETSPLILHNKAGILSMAKTSQPNSAGSQYFITLASYPHLDGTYAAFGEVIEGLDIVFNISHVAVNANDKPLVPVVIDSLRILGLEVGEINPADTLLTAEADETLNFSVEAYDVNEFIEASYQWLVDGDIISNEVGAFNFTFTEPGEHIIKCIVSDSQVDFPYSWYVSVIPNTTQDHTINIPAISCLSNYPNPFKSEINIVYQCAKNQAVDISIYDIKGRKINTYQQIQAGIGENTWVWDGKNMRQEKVANGIYFYQIEAKGEKAVGKIMLIN